MMPGINCDRAFSSSNKVEGDLSRVFRKSLSSSILLPDKNLRLAKGDIFDELPVFKQHPVHHLHVDVDVSVMMIMMMIMVITVLITLTMMTWFPPLHHLHGSLAK